MSTINIKGAPPYDGVYDLPMPPYSGRENHIIKVISGAAGLQVVEAFENVDNDLLYSLAAVALDRAGHQVNIRTFWDSPLARAAGGAVTFDFTDDDVTAEDDADPPALTPPAQPVDASGTDSSSGPSSNGSAANQEHPQRPIGAPL